jgi:hypothetical protein
LPNNPNQCDWCQRAITDNRCSCGCGAHGFDDGTIRSTRNLVPNTLYACTRCCRDQRHVIMACGHCISTACEHVRHCEVCAARTDEGEGWDSVGAISRGVLWSQHCACCSDTTTCVNCCRHRCCSGDSGHSIRFVGHRLAFWVPTTDPLYQRHKGYAALSAEDAAGVLGKQLGYRFVDPRGFKRNKSRRFASTEIEVDTFIPGGFKPLNQTISTWQACVVRDGSVGGFEINTSPACGDALPDQIYEICEGLEQVRAGVQENCGLHVHVDCRDFGYQEIRKLIKLYVEFEETLFAAVHRSRYDNRYSRHCAQQYLERMVLGLKPEKQVIKRAIIEQTYGRGSADGRPGVVPIFHQTRREHYGGGAGSPRYNALNIHSFFMRGTIESRLHHGSVLPGEIYQWAKMWVEIMDAVGKLSDHQVDDIVTVSGQHIADMTRDLGLGTKKYTRPDVAQPRVAKGAVVLCRLLSADSMDALMGSIRYFGPSRAKVPSMAMQEQRGDGQQPVNQTPAPDGVRPRGSRPMPRDYFRVEAEARLREQEVVGGRRIRVTTAPDGSHVYTLEDELDPPFPDPPVFDTNLNNTR